MANLHVQASEHDVTNPLGSRRNGAFSHAIVSLSPDVLDAPLASTLATSNLGDKQVLGPRSQAQPQRVEGRVLSPTPTGPTSVFGTQAPAQAGKKQRGQRDPLRSVQVGSRSDSLSAFHSNAAPLTDLKFGLSAFAVRPQTGKGQQDKENRASQSGEVVYNNVFNAPPFRTRSSKGPRTQNHEAAPAARSVFSEIAQSQFPQRSHSTVTTASNSWVTKLQTTATATAPAVVNIPPFNSTSTSAYFGPNPSSAPAKAWVERSSVPRDVRSSSAAVDISPYRRSTATTAGSGIVKASALRSAPCVAKPWDHEVPRVRQDKIFRLREQESPMGLGDRAISATKPFGNCSHEEPRQQYHKSEPQNASCSILHPVSVTSFDFFAGSASIRPVSQPIPLPLSLRCPIFGEFLDDLETGSHPQTNATATAQDLSTWLTTSSDFEPALFCSIFRILVRKHFGFSMNKDGLFLGPYMMLSVCYQEDLTFTPILDFFKSKSFGDIAPPAFHLVFNESWMIIAGSISTRADRYCEALTEPIYLRSSRRDSSSFLCMTKSLAALALAIPRLKADHQVTSLARARSVPYPTSFQSLLTQDLRVAMHILNPNPPDQLQFFATCSYPSSIFSPKGSPRFAADLPLTVSVSFVKRRSYSTQLHELCVNAGYAPDLMAYESLPGGWSMIVTKRLDLGIIVAFDSASHAEPVKPGLEHLLKICHANGLVLGSLRRDNVRCLFGSPGKFVLLRLDAGGVLGEVKHGLNADVGIPGVVPGALITKEHDIAMLDALLGCRS